MVYVPVRGYQPDANPTAQGALKDGDNIVPTIRGMEGAPSPVDGDPGAVSASAVGALSLVESDGTVRVFAGTATKLYEAGSGVWNDRTRASSDYSGVATWRFAVFGDTALAAAPTAPIQSIGSGGSNFDDISGAPKASIIEVVNTQAIAFATNDATFGDQKDRWRTSAVNDVTDWNISISTLSASARLIATPGAIVGARRLGDDVVAYKQRSMYLGRFVGPPEAWDFTVVSEQIGAVNHEVIVSIDTAHFFMGTDDFYVYDGSFPRPIGEPIRDTFFNNEVNRDHFDRVYGVWDRKNSRIYWFYPGQGSEGAPDMYICYHYKADRWGPPTALDSEVAFEFVSTSGVTYDNFGNLFSTYDDITGLTYDDSFWTTQSRNIAIFNRSHKLQTLNGGHGSSTLVFNDFGADENYLFLSRVRPRFNAGENPTSGTLRNSFRDNLGDNLTSDSPTTALVNGSFDLERSSRWHELSMDYSGSYEIVGVNVEVQPDGDE